MQSHPGSQNINPQTVTIISQIRQHQQQKILHQMKALNIPTEDMKNIVILFVMILIAGKKNGNEDRYGDGDGDGDGDEGIEVDWNKAKEYLGRGEKVYEEMMEIGVEGVQARKKGLERFVKERKLDDPELQAKLPKLDRQYYYLYQWASLFLPILAPKQ